MNKFRTLIYTTPIFAAPLLFITRLLVATFWGCVLSQNLEHDNKLVSCAVLAGLILILSPVFMYWYSKPLTTAGIALAALYVVGQFATIGTLCLAFQGAYTGTWSPWAMVLTSFMGSLFTIFPSAVFEASQLEEARGE